MSCFLVLSILIVSAMSARFSLPAYQTKCYFKQVSSPFDKVHVDIRTSLVDPSQITCTVSFRHQGGEQYKQNTQFSLSDQQTKTTLQSGLQRNSQETKPDPTYNSRYKVCLKWSPPPLSKEASQKDPSLSPFYTPTLVQLNMYTHFSDMVAHFSDPALSQINLMTHHLLEICHEQATIIDHSLQGEDKLTEKLATLKQSVFNFGLIQTMVVVLVQCWMVWMLKRRFTEWLRT